MSYKKQNVESLPSFQTQVDDTNKGLSHLDLAEHSSNSIEM